MGREDWTWATLASFLAALALPAIASAATKVVFGGYAASD